MVHLCNSARFSASSASASTSAACAIASSMAFRVEGRERLSVRGDIDNCGFDGGAVGVEVGSGVGGLGGWEVPVFQSVVYLIRLLHASFHFSPL